ncbi:MAG: AAA family ATPase [Planctomycetota bacterium]|nr:AAA family ATPase [Planctomycetota bacterium]
MKITDLQIDGFGVWNDLKLDQFSDGCTVFFGQNEAGKTTLMEFIRSVLYGFSAERRSRYLPPVRGGQGGGSLGVAGAGGQYIIKRTPGSSLHSEDLGKLEVTSPNGARQGQHVLGTLLSGIDEPIFNNVFAVGLRELQELSTLDDTEASAHLYKLTSGLDRVSLIDVIRELETARTRLLAADGSKSELLELVARREKLRLEIKELTGKGQRWAQLTVHRLEVQEELARLEENIHRMERESRSVEVALQVREDWFRRAGMAAQLKKLGPPVKLPERAIARLDELNGQIAKHREEVEQIKRQRRQLMEEAVAQPVNRNVCAHANRIEAVCEHAPWLTSLEGQTTRLREEIDELQTDLRLRWEKLGLNPDEMPEITPDLAARAATLRDPARAVRDATKRVQDGKVDHEATHREALELHEQLSTQLADTGRTELGEALEEAGKRVAAIRRRLQVDERLEKIERHRQEMAEDRHDLLEEQVLPLPKLVWCGLPFIAGVMMMLGGFFWDWGAKYGWAFAILGLVCTGVAVVVKVFLEQAVTDDLDDCRRQVDKVEKQIRELLDERDQLDSLLPPGGGPMDARLLAAEEYVRQLEELTPLETKRQTALQRAEAVQGKADKAQETLREARDQWRDALRAANLPPSLTPEHVQHLVEGNDQTLEFGRRLQVRRADFQQRQTELTAVIGRINKLFEDVHLTAASEDPRTRLRQMAAALTEQRRWIERRHAMRQEHRAIKHRFREVARELGKLAQQRRGLLNQAKVVNEEQLRKLAVRQAKIEELTTQQAALNTRISLGIGTQSTEPLVGEVLATHKDDKLEQYWDRLLSRMQEAQGRLTQLHQSRGEMLQEMKTLSENRRLPGAKLELGCLDEQIQCAAKRWRLLAVTSLMLEDIRQIYETERQPETLAEASTYLVELTEGRYRRIWTPLSQDGLRLDTAEGESLPLDVLSTGTREAIFVSLRLALASAYARRGALLPLVLDDVLVNLDLRRAKAAVEVLRSFAAKGHQLLLFTCHHHIVKLFLQADIEVRPLPTRDGQTALDWFEEERVAAAKAPSPEPAPEPEPEVVEAVREVPVEPVVEDLHPELDEVDSLIEAVVADEALPLVPRVRKRFEELEEVEELEDVEEEVEELEEVEAPVAQAEEPVPEPVEDEYDHSIWDDGREFTLADAEERLDADPLAPAQLGVAQGHWTADRWWEPAAEEPAA